MLEDIYVDMDIALPIDGEGPDFSKLKKRLQDENGIPIYRTHENTMLDTRVYEVEYLDVHKESLAANTIAEIYFRNLIKGVIDLFCIMIWCIIVFMGQRPCSSTPSLFQIIEEREVWRLQKSGKFSFSGNMYQLNGIS